MLSDKCGIIVTGRAHYCNEENKIWEPTYPQYYTAQLVYERNGEKEYEDIELGFGDECILLSDIHFPEDVGVDFTKLDMSGDDKFEVRNQIGPYKYDGVYVSVYAEFAEVDEFTPSNRPHEEKSYDDPYSGSNDASYDSAEEYTVEEYAVDSGPGDYGSGWLWLV